MSDRRGHRNAFTLIELLVVISIIALLIAILLPSLSAAKSQSLFTKSQANLKAIGDLAATFAAESHLPASGAAGTGTLPNIPDGVMHPQSSGGETNYLGLGAWDWGGGNGHDPVGPQNPEYQQGQALQAVTRPLSRMALGQGFTGNSDFSIFRAPIDEGMASNPNYGGDTPIELRSQFESKGTSYQGDFIWFTGNGSPMNALRFGAFMRPVTKMPDPSQLVLFYETRFSQAFISAQEFIDGGAFGGTAVDVPGWYGKLGEFAVGFCDGHASKIKLRKQGDMFPITGYNINTYPLRSVMARGTGWRIDAFPAPLVREDFVGNP